MKNKNRLKKMNEFRNEIIKLNEKTKETFQNLKQYINKNGIKDIEKSITEKNVSFL